MLPALLAAALTVSAPRPKDRPAAEEIEGRWAATSLTTDGTANPQSAGLEYEFRGGGRWVIYRNGDELAGGPRTYTFDPKVRPAAIDLTEGMAGKPYRGIYKVDGEELSLAFHTGGGDRPSDFAPRPGVITLVMKRVQEKK